MPLDTIDSVDSVYEGQDEGLAMSFKMVVTNVSPLYRPLLILSPSTNCPFALFQFEAKTKCGEDKSLTSRVVYHQAVPAIGWYLVVFPTVLKDSKPRTDIFLYLSGRLVGPNSPLPVTTTHAFVLSAMRGGQSPRPTPSRWRARWGGNTIVFSIIPPMRSLPRPSAA